jgi:ABC-type amino acid transport substrate-binding protein
MSKLCSILLLVALLVGTLTGCGKSVTTTQAVPAVSQPAKPVQKELTLAEYARLINGKTIATISRVKTEAESEQTYQKRLKSIDSSFDLKGIVYFDSLTDGLLMLRSGKVDILELTSFTGDYLAQRDSDLNVYSDNGWMSTTHMLFSPQKQAQYDKTNTALKAMRQDGTLEKLIGKWITNLPAGQEPSGGTLPTIEGAQTIKMGICGDEPPLDYIAANGTPGGFNVAVLKEISQRAQINIELVPVNGLARFAALQSGKIDAFLWYNATQSVYGETRTVSSTLKINSYTALMTDNYLTVGNALVTKK